MNPTKHNSPHSQGLGSTRARQNGIMVERSRLIQASPEAIFLILSDPANLASIMPRVKQIEVLSRDADSARVRTHMALGPFGAVHSEGEVRWLTNREIVFSSTQPVAIETQWLLTPANNGTSLRAIMVLDLSPMMGPLASFVPQDSVSAMIAPDLDAALAAIARKVEELPLKERAAGK